MTKGQTPEPEQTTTATTSAEFESLKRLYEKEKTENILLRNKFMQYLVGTSTVIDLVLKQNQSITGGTIEKMGDLNKVTTTLTQVRAQLATVMEEMKKEDEQVVKQDQQQ